MLSRPVDFTVTAGNVKENLRHGAGRAAAPCKNRGRQGAQLLKKHGFTTRKNKTKI
jgi:hypothetical protein